MSPYDYVLVTAARNEEAHIERVIKAVIAQSILPLQWIIISDGSTDRTDEIVKSYIKKYDFIKLLRSVGDEKRNFGSKALAIRAGAEHMSELGYGYIGVLDADVSFSPTYYQTLLARFKNNNRLGIVGGVRQELKGDKFKAIITPRNSVGGPVQFFSRKCFEDIGGYMPLKYGGIDAAAEITARMKGWKIETFDDVDFFHYRSTGSADQSFIRARYRSGRKNYLLGYHPVFLTLMVVKKMIRRGLFDLGGPIELAGYTWGGLRRECRPVSAEFVKYLRAEQLFRMKTFLLSGKDPANE